MKDLDLKIRISADGSGLKATVAGATGDLGRLGASGGQAGQAINTGMNAAQRGVQSVNEQLQAARNQLIAFFSVQYAANQAGQLIQLADLAKTVDARLRLATTSAQEYARAQQDVNAIADRTRAPLAETADLYGKMAVAVRELGRGQSDAAATTEAIAQSLKISGSSAAAAQGALMQFGQALASGILRGDEFNSVMEAAPRLTKALADGLGVPRGELRALAEQGKLTADQIINALLSQKDKLAAEYARMPVTVADALTGVRNQFMRLVAGFDQATGATSAIAGAMGGLARNLDTVVAAAGAVASLLIGRGVAALTAWTAATVAQSRAHIAERAAAEAAVIAAQRQMAAYGGLGGAAAALTVAQQRLAATTTLTSGAMAMLGGPVGIIATAVTALGLWAATTQTAKADTDRLSSSLDGLASGMNRVTAADAAGRIVQLREALAKVGGNPAASARLREMIAENERIIQDATRQQARIQAELDKAAVKPSSGKSASTGQNPPGGDARPQFGLDDQRDQAIALADDYIRAFEATRTPLERFNAEIQQASALFERFGDSDLFMRQATAAQQYLPQAASPEDDPGVAQQRAQAEAWASLQRSLTDQNALVEQKYLERAQIITNALQQGWDNEAQSQAAMLEISRQYLVERNDMEGQANIGRTAASRQYLEQNKSFAQEFSDVWGNAAAGFTANIGRSVADAILEQKNFSDLLRTSVRSMAREVIAALISIAAKRAALWIAEKMGLISTAAVAAPAAAAVTLASLGSNVPIAMAGIAATFAATRALAGQAHDGIESIPRTGTWILEQGERVVKKEDNKRLSDFLDREGSSGDSRLSVIFNVNAVDTRGMEGLLTSRRNQIISMIQSAYDERGRRGGPIS